VTATTQRRHEMREREVLDHVREFRVISVFWLQDPLTRWAALRRLEERGEIKVNVLGYPNYRVTMRRKVAA